MPLGRLLLYLMTALSFVMVGYALLVAPPPVWVPLVYFGVYAAMIVWGVMNLRLGMFGDAISEVPQARGQVALTFDDGPDPRTTPLVLEELRQADARATFFVLGRKAEQHPELLRSIVEQGHALGVHSYDHPRFYSLLSPKKVEADIQRTRTIIENAVGQRPVWFRPPVGQMSPRTARGADLADAVVVGWTTRGRDGLRKTTAQQCARRIERGLEEGAIVLLHDAWESRELLPHEDALAAAPAGVRALPEILRTCKQRGLRPVTIGELVRSLPLPTSDDESSPGPRAEVPSRKES